MMISDDDRLIKALDEIIAMKAPSVESILRTRRFRYEANRIKELTDTYESWKEDNRKNDADGK